MGNYTLSICIPTYNFGEYIAETLDSIVEQINDNVEVVIVDGASTDNTQDIVKKYVEAYSQVKYFRLEVRGGIDRDMSTSIDLANGKYCWTFSADDVIQPGALNRILSEISFGYDIILCRHKYCTIDMETIGDYPVLDLKNDEEFIITNTKERERYFSLGMTTEAFFSFMGGVVIKRKKWTSIPLKEQFVGSCWAHVARIFELMQSGIFIKYINEPCLKKRGEIDSFRENGLVQRYRLAIEGYNDITEYYFGIGSKEVHHVRRVLRNEFTIKHFLYAKLLCSEQPEREDKKLLDSLVKKVCIEVTVNNIITRIVYWITPVWTCYLAKYFYELWLGRGSRILKSD